VPDAEFHEKRREKFIEEKEKLERRWGWLAYIVAGTVLGFLRLIQSYLKFCFSCLQSGPQGFLFLIGLHLLLILLILL